jgi:hypothetical protein
MKEGYLSYNPRLVPALERDSGHPTRIPVKRTLPALAAIVTALLFPVSALAADNKAEGQSGESLGKEHVTEFMFILILVLIGILALLAVWEVRKSKRK